MAEEMASHLDRRAEQLSNSTGMFWSRSEENQLRGEAASASPENFQTEAMKPQRSPLGSECVFPLPRSGRRTRGVGFHLHLQALTLQSRAYFF